MNLSIYLSLLVCLVGVVCFLLFNRPPNPPAPAPGPSVTSERMNRVFFAMFWVGLFVFLLQYPGIKSIAFLK